MRLRHDLNFLVSVALLVVATGAILTGATADLWDLNDFSWHTWSGYAMTFMALAHVALNWRRMVAYGRFRVQRAQRGVARREPRPPRPAPAGSPRGTGTTTGGLQPVLSRRGLLGVAAGGLGGWLFERGLRAPPALARGSDIGLVYHEWSKPGVVDMLGTLANWGERPPPFKDYPEARQVTLPEGAPSRGLATEDAILARRSCRTYSGAALSLGELSQVLRLTGGATSERGLRATPSSGALYPIEIYPVVHHVEGLAPGVYHYGVANHRLDELRVGNFREAVVRQALFQEFLGETNVVLLFTVLFQRMRFKYQDRSYRYGLIEAGHYGQNAYLAATSIGLGACGVGAFRDNEINALLGLDGVQEAAVYLVAVGRK